MGRNSVTSIAPGFRFHPTDEELVRYYLRRKVSGKAFRFDPIGVIDIYKSEPWDLPSQSKLKNRDLEWYFFSALDKKYGNSSRTNRATEKGYWKTTGKDRTVRHSSRTVGMKKTLVYHSGRAPRGTRSNWVMHEYRLADEELSNKGIQQDAFVLCRIFQKSGTGPKNGEQYGAPFLEEEWENDEVAPPGEEAGEEDVVFGDGAYVETNDLDQKLDMVMESESNAVPKNFVCGESSSYREQSQEFEYQRPVVGTDGTFEAQDDQFLNMVEQFQEFIEEQKPNVGMDGAFEPHHAQFLDKPKPDMVSENVKDNYTEASHDENALNFSFALDDLYLDAADVLPIFDGLFLEANDLVNPIETNDLVNPIEADPSGVEMVDDYLSFFDTDDDITQYISFDSPDIMGTENPVPDQTQPFIEQNANEGSGDASMANKHDLEAHCSNEASSSKQKTDDSKLVSGNTYPFIKHASHLLGSIPAPPAFAAEFPPKEVALQLHSAAQSSNSAHFTAGMIRISNINLRGNGMDWTQGKNGEISFLVSSGSSQPDTDSAVLGPVSGLLSGKTAFMVSHGWVYLVFFSVLILSLSYKIGSLMYTGK